MKKFFISIIFLWMLAGMLPVLAQNVNLETPIAVDPNVKIGKLDNGMTYYIRKNIKPENRVELRLAVNTGSVMENDDQQGLAHFTEHMCFNGTRNFPKNELINFLQKSGVGFGADINAYTSFDETVYMLQLPTDEKGLLEKGYQVLEDWAHYVTFDSKEIDKERGVITEEWRLGLGADDRMMKKYLPIIFQGSKYAERVPIGKIDIIENFKHETLRSFYHDWYRPDLQSIMIVGDVNVDSAEAYVKAHFGSIPASDVKRERTVYDLPANKDPLIAIETDKEATNNTVFMFYKHPHVVKKTLGDFREGLLEELYNAMLSSRLSELAQKPDCPFVNASTSYGSFLARNCDAYLSYGMSKENQIGKTLETIMNENQRVKLHGFTATEFEREKKSMFSEYETASKEFDKTESSHFASQYVDNFLSGEPIPGAQKAFKYMKNLLPGITLEEVNALAQKWITDDNLALVITAPDKPGVIVPTKEEVLNIINKAKTANLDAWVDNYKEAPLVEDQLSGGTVTSKKTDDALGLTELTLSNGVQVILKPTTFKNDEVLLSAYSPGGSSLYADDQFISANYTTQVINMSGIGQFDNIALQKKLQGKIVELTPYIDDIKEGLNGKVSPKDLETLFELTYLYFKSPRKDTATFRTFISQTKNQLKFMKSNPVMAFYDTIFKSAYPGYKRMIIFPSEKQIDQINLDLLYRIYQERFADASDFKFFIVGSFKVDSIMPFIEKYLGSLPSINRNETWKDLSPKLADGVKTVTFKKGQDPQSMVAMVMSDPMEWTDKDRMGLSMLKEILEIKLVEVIREKLSGVYSPQVMANFEKYPKAHFDFMVFFGCSPKTTDKLSKAVFGEMEKIRKKGPTEVDLGKAKESLIRQRETSLEKNEFWLKYLENGMLNGDDYDKISTYKDRVQAMTIEDLKLAADKYFRTDHYVRVVLMPENNK